MALKIGEVAERGGVNLQTIRYYEREKLLPEPPRRPSGYRMFPEQTVHRVRLFMRHGEGVSLQLKSAKQLSIGGYDDGGKAHRDRPHTHREIESPMDEKASSDRNSDNVIGRRPNQVLDHFSIGSAG